MRASGVIVEYNPFHNGHLYHLKETKKTSQSDIVIAVMSGHFLQRGEPALVSKWARTKMALEAGVDLIIELPYSFATQHAEVFARGAISLLNELGCDSFCFGSEDGNIEGFESTVKLIEDNEREYNSLIKKFVQTGMSYPSALANAYEDLSTEKDGIDLSKPNNILGYHYIQARNSLHSSMRAYTISRHSAQYHDEFFSSPSIASATSIRKTIFNGDNQNQKNEINNFLPTASTHILKKYKEEFGEYHRWESYWPILQYKIISSSKEYLNSLYEIEEGIENRMIDAVRHSTNFGEFMDRLKTKRYTWTRLQRMLLHILTNTTKEEMAQRHRSPTYIRLLGMNRKGREFLNKQKKELSLPLISKLSSAKEQNILLDVRAAEVYSLGLSNPEARKRLLHQEWSQPPILF